MSVIAAGLPNITGQFSCAKEWSWGFANGAFREVQGDGSGPEGAKWTNGKIVGFDASRCAQIYGASNTVQPLAVQQILQIKY